VNPASAPDLKARRRLARHVIVAGLLILAAITGLVPFIPGSLFCLTALLILSVDYPVIRDVFLRPLRRLWPSLFQKASRWRRSVRLRFSGYAVNKPRLPLAALATRRLAPLWKRWARPIRRPGGRPSARTSMRSPLRIRRPRKLHP